MRAAWFELTASPTVVGGAVAEPPIEWTAGGMDMRVAIMAALAGAIGFTGPAFALDKVTFGTNWVADPEAGGYFQALVDGTYAKYGLDVTILQGGPMSNGGMLLIAGKIEFFMGGDMIGDFLAVQNNIPTIAVAAHFQKNPQIFMSHPGVGLDKWQDLPNANPAFVSAGAVNTFWAWMRLAYGFKDDNIKPYNFNSAPFIAEPRSIQQGYLTSEPLEVEKHGGFKPNVFLLADYGYSTYSTIVETRRELVEKHPDIVQRFVDASSIGWYHYLYGDNSKANEAIKRENPEITEDEIAFSIAKMKAYGIVDSGDTLKLGIGAMTDERWSGFYNEMVKAGVVKPGIDYKKAYTLQFVNKAVGLDLRPK
jgi:NitT/TauT family transport system substrate-binding protein